MIIQTASGVGPTGRFNLIRPRPGRIRAAALLPLARLGAYETRLVALMLAGRPAEAIARFTSALALNGPDDIHQRLAEAYAAVGRGEDSRRELELYEKLKQARLQRTGADR